MVEVTREIGKILFVDDRYDDDIKRAVTELVKNGLTVQYWDGEKPIPKTIRNVRVVVIDLDLAGAGTRSGGFSDYSLAVDALHDIPGPYVVIIMAQDFESTDPQNLNHYYKVTYGPLCGYIAEQGLSKVGEAADPSLLGSLISKSINDTLELIFLWEAIVNKAKDTAMREFFVGNVEKTVNSLVKLLCLDVGEESAARELVNIVTRLVSRRTREASEYTQMKTLISKLNKTKMTKANHPTSEDIRLFNRLMFFEPDSTENVWTGDIYRTTTTTGWKYNRYAIVFSPKCDLVLHKTQSIMVCYGFPVLEKYLDSPNFPPMKHDKKVVERLENDKQKLLKWVEKRHPNNASSFQELLHKYPRITSSILPNAITEKVKEKRKNFLKWMQKRYLEEGELPENLYTLWHFIEEKSAYPICFDFNNVACIEFQHLKKWKRICRLDFPFIEEMIEKYGTLVSRIGVPRFNKSPKQLNRIF